jgi:hypothetical protein
MKISLLAFTAFLVVASSGQAQSTAFTYQGRLNDGTNGACGSYDFVSTLFPTNVSGAAAAGPITNTAVAVSNGLFSLTLDFGPAAFTGADRWLEIGVRGNGFAGGFTTLFPRQALTPSPYAVFAAGASAAGLRGTIADGQLSTNVALLNAMQSFGGLVGFTNPSNLFAGSFAGNGSSITNLAVDYGWTNGVYVSPGHLGPTSKIFNADTPGTATSGIQEAINALYQASSIDFKMGGGKVVLLPGVYLCSTQIAIPSSYPFSLVLEGSGEGNTAVVNQSPREQDLFVLSNPGRGPGIQLVVRDLMLCRAPVYDTNHDALIHINPNEMLLDNVIFATQQCVSSNQYNGPLVYTGGRPTNAVGTVGLWVDQCFGRVVLRRCRFYGLAGGAILGGDHVQIYDPLFSNVGYYYTNANESGPVSRGSSWKAVPDADPSDYAAAINNILSQGAALVALDGNFEFEVLFPHFFVCNLCMVNYTALYNGVMALLFDPIVEECSYRYVTAIDAGGDDRAKGNIVVWGSMNAALPNTPDGFIDVATGKMVASSPNGESSLYTTTIGVDGGVTQTLNGKKLFSLSAAGDLNARGQFQGNGAGLTNLIVPNYALASGLAALSNGTATVSTSAANGTNSILLTYRSLDGSLATVGVANVAADASFQILSSNGNDTNQVTWVIYKP